MSIFLWKIWPRYKLSVEQKFSLKCIQQSVRSRFSKLICSSFQSDLSNFPAFITSQCSDRSTSFCFRKGHQMYPAVQWHRKEETYLKAAAALTPNSGCAVPVRRCPSERRRWDGPAASLTWGVRLRKSVTKEKPAGMMLHEKNYNNVLICTKEPQATCCCFGSQINKYIVWM